MEKLLKPSNRHLVELVIATFFISTSGPLGRFIEMSPPVIIWWRCLVALIVLYAYCRFKNISLKLHQKKDWVPFIISAVFTGGHWIAYFYALKLSNVALGMLSLYTFPVIISLLEPLFSKTKLHPTHIFLGIMVFTGIYILAPDFNLKNTYVLGILLGVLSALLFALRILILKKHIANYNGSMLMTYQLLIVVIVFSPIVFLMDSSNLPEVYPYIILLGVLTTAVGHTMLVHSLKHFTATTASIISSMQPVFGILLAIIALHEIPTWNTFVGGAIIIATVVIETRRTRQ